MSVSPRAEGARDGRGRVGGRGEGRGGATLVLTVARTEQLSPTMVRVVLTGDDLAQFTMNEFSDAYVKLIYPRAGIEYDRPIDMKAIRTQLPQSQWPQNRTYTVRRWDEQARELSIDFVVHGDEGLAGPWARDAKPGDEIWLAGPGGGYRPEPGADWHLLVGDESALPAVAASLEAMPDDAKGIVLLEIHDPASELKLTAPAGVEVRWLLDTGRPAGTVLVEAVTALEFPAGTVHAFVHGEAAAMRDLRRFLKRERGVKQSQLSISGYWRIGANDEEWRAVKSDFQNAP
ncbi:siderophore-interacting protein [Kineosporia mesophila]|uniref:Siderophore-interacting protein n=1 Tax=Kineosporia mesophila TaxID=566012 RepID=A0ABP6ZWM5_9ACTN|nr:siderophore-interacting protein [Kineosporia mesophila]MCD5348615.1 siderophore-interacting protein [Kineosporia mesophila]